MKIKTKYNVRDKVWIPEIKRPGTIIGFFIGIDEGLQYRIVYFAEGVRKNEYFFDFEIQEKK